MSSTLSSGTIRLVSFLRATSRCHYHEKANKTTRLKVHTPSTRIAHSSNSRSKDEARLDAGKEIGFSLPSLRSCKLRRILSSERHSQADSKNDNDKEIRMGTLNRFFQMSHSPTAHNPRLPNDCSPPGWKKHQQSCRHVDSVGLTLLRHHSSSCGLRRTGISEVASCIKPAIDDANSQDCTCILTHVAHLLLSCLLTQELSYDLPLVRVNSSDTDVRTARELQPRSLTSEGFRPNIERRPGLRLGL